MSFRTSECDLDTHAPALYIRMQRESCPHMLRVLNDEYDAVMADIRAHNAGVIAPLRRLRKAEAGRRTAGRPPIDEAALRAALWPLLAQASDPRGLRPCDLGRRAPGWKLKTIRRYLALWRSQGIVRQSGHYFSLMTDDALEDTL